LRYIGGYQESTNLYKMGARYYDATLGRFTQIDPSGQEKQQYSYAGCNPINSADPTGLAPNGCNVGLLGIGLGFGALWGVAGLIAAPALAVGIGLVYAAGIGAIGLYCD
jgi:RHS repeat-associated protein